MNIKIKVRLYESTEVIEKSFSEKDDRKAIVEFINSGQCLEYGFKIQDGPIKENGYNGCQIDDMIWISSEIIKKVNSKFPCRQNSIVLTKLEEAGLWLLKRKMDREERGVEGKSLK